MKMAYPMNYERHVQIPAKEHVTGSWTNHFLYKKEEKWYEYFESEWIGGWGHNDGVSMERERPDLNDELVDNWIKERDQGHDVKISEW